MAQPDINERLAFDKAHIWHPYTSTTKPIPAYYVESGKGVHLQLADGRKLIDGMSSWWCAIHGYSHPALNAAITAQINEISHVMFGGITHGPAVDLCKKLVEITPSALDKVFLCDSGSVSVEVAIKMALQYWSGKGQQQKNKFITVRGGYHGDTFGAMSVCDPVNGMHHLFSGVLPQQIFIPKPVARFAEPLSAEDERNLVAAFEEHSAEAAAFILEPIVQGAGGMHFYSPAFLARVKSLCLQYDVLLIVDEIATGFGRTGRLFASEHANVEPDIMCIGKALTGGMLTMAATLCSDEVATTICGENRVFMHGPTFMANPLACSVAIASIELLQANDWSTQVKQIETSLQAHLTPLATHKKVKEIRVLGAIGVVECQHNIHVPTIQKYFVDQGVWIRPFRNLIYLMPPFIANGDQLKKLCQVVGSSLDIDEHFVSN